MLNIVLLYVGSAVITLWGIAHLVPTMSIVRGFGVISVDNRFIVIMEWIVEGLVLIFIGLLIFSMTLIAGHNTLGARIVYWLCFCMLVTLSILSFFTGARTSVLPMKICPFVKLLVAAFLVPSII